MILTYVSLSLGITSLSIRSGNLYNSNLVGYTDTMKWSALYGSISSTGSSVSLRPLSKRSITSSSFISDSIIGNNFSISDSELVLLPINTSFDLNLVSNSSVSDLSENSGLFSSSLYSGKDNPELTFKCNPLMHYKIFGLSYSGCYVILKNNILMGLLKYYYNGKYYPLYIVNTSSYSCYDGSSCEYEFLLPLGEYYIYDLSSKPLYHLDVYIDNLQTTHFSQTALPYLLKLKVTNYFTHSPLSNVSVSLSESNSNNIFVPWRLNGLISRYESFSKTDTNGSVKFIVSPTDYQSPSYNISASVLSNGKIVKSIQLHVDNYNSIEYNKKPITPSRLLDNSKVSINAMNQIVNSLYIWANSASGSDSPQPEAIYLHPVVYLNGSHSPIHLQTGAPNLINITLKSPSGSVLKGYVSVSETNGYLVMNPTYHQSVLNPKHHLSSLEYIPTSKNFIVTPTSYGDCNSSISFKIYDSSYNYITTINASIDSNLEPRHGIYYNNDNLKVIINAMSSVLNSLYYSLN